MKNCRLRASSPGVPGGTGVGEGRGDWLELGLGRLGLGLSPAARGPRESLLADFSLRLHVFFQLTLVIWIPSTPMPVFRVHGIRPVLVQ